MKDFQTTTRTLILSSNGLLSGLLTETSRSCRHVPNACMCKQRQLHYCQEAAAILTCHCLTHPNFRDGNVKT